MLSSYNERYNFSVKMAAGNSNIGMYPPPPPPAPPGFAPRQQNYQYMNQNANQQEYQDDRSTTAKTVHNVLEKALFNPVTETIGAFGLMDMTAKHLIMQDPYKAGKYRLGIPGMVTGAIHPAATVLSSDMAPALLNPLQKENWGKTLKKWTSIPLGDKISQKIENFVNKAKPYFVEGGALHKPAKFYNRAAHIAGLVGMGQMFAMVPYMLTAPKPPKPQQPPQFQFQPPDQNNNNNNQNFKVASMRDF